MMALFKISKELKISNVFLYCRSVKLSKGQDFTDAYTILGTSINAKKQDLH
jgi:hypothetical protein